MNFLYADIEFLIRKWLEQLDQIKCLGSLPLATNKSHFTHSKRKHSKRIQCLNILFFLFHFILSSSLFIEIRCSVGTVYNKMLQNEENYMQGFSQQVQFYVVRYLHDFIHDLITYLRCWKLFSPLACCIISWEIV